MMGLLTKQLSIHMASEAGADAAKFQNFMPKHSYQIMVLKL